MAVNCDEFAAELTQSDAAVYARAGTHGQKVVAAKRLLKEAFEERKQLILAIQEAHPDLINNKGEFLDDIEAAKIDAEEAAKEEAKSEPAKKVARKKKTPEKKAADPGNVAVTPAGLQEFDDGDETSAAPVTETKTYDWSTPAGRKEAVIDAYVEDWNVSLEVATWMVNDNYGEATKELRNDYNEEYREYQRDENVDEFYEAFWPELTTLIGEPFDVPVAKPKTKTKGEKRGT